MFDKPRNIYKKKQFDNSMESLKDIYPRNYCGDNMFIASRNMHFFEDIDFQNCVKKFAKAEPYIGMSWRMHIITWCVKQTQNLSGDIAEFGTFRGFKMRFMIEYMGNNLRNKIIYLFDTFEGIDIDQSVGSPIKPDDHQKSGLYDYVCNRFKNFKNVKIVKGSAPKSIEKVNINKLSFIHLDMNSWMAEIGVLEKMWDKIEIGGIILLDDFGLYSHRSQKEKELIWFNKKNHSPLELPTGQAIIIKHV
ncbi:MAG: TylF/MycF/NovP-related O-methyltransferase [Rickettsiales bacterium]